MSETYLDTLNRADLNSLADMARGIQFGTILSHIPRTIRAQVPVANTIALPNNLKAHRIMSAWMRTGSQNTGNLTVAAYGAAPNAGEVGIGANGNILFNNADGVTSVDVVYYPTQGDIVTLDLQVVANVATLPTSIAAVKILSATATVGGVTGACTVLFPAAGAPAATQCRLNVALTTVSFAVADAVTRCTLVVEKASALEIGALLNATSTII